MSASMKTTFCDKKRYITCFLLCLFFTLTTCRKEEDAPLSPLLFTGEVTNITRDGAVLTGKFKNVDPEKVKAYGFILHEEESKNSQFVFLPLPYKNEVVNFMSYSLKEDVVYSVQTFVFYPENTYFGNLVSFLNVGSTPPQITKVSATNINFGDTLALNVSFVGLDVSRIEAFFNNEKGIILNYSDSILKLIVPHFNARNTFFKDGEIHLYLNRFNSYSDSIALTLLPPQISNPVTKEAYSSTSFLIKGKGFHSTLGKFKLGAHYLEKVSFSNENVRLAVPAFYENYHAPLEYHFKSGVIDEVYKICDFTVMAPIFDSYSKEKVSFHDELIIYGKQLMNENLNFKIYAEPSGLSYQVNHINRFDDSIVLTLPEELCAIKIKLYSYMNSGSSSNYLKTFIIKNPDDASYTVNPEYPHYPFFNIEFSSHYFPNNHFIISQNEVGVDKNFDHINHIFNPIDHHTLIEVIPSPTSVLADGWVDFKIDFCYLTNVTFNSVFKVPAPIIDVTNDTIVFNDSILIKGNYFNDRYINNIIIDGFSRENSIAKSPTEIYFIPSGFFFTEGEHTIQIKTNGQLSNIEKFYFKVQNN